MLERRQREIAAGAFQYLDQPVREPLNVAVLQPPRGDDVRTVHIPELVDDAADRLARLVGHVHTRERLDEGLVGADPEHVPVDFQLVDRVLEIVPVAAETGQQDDALGMHVGFVRMRRQVVSRL